MWMAVKPRFCIFITIHSILGGRFVVWRLACSGAVTRVYGLSPNGNVVLPEDTC